MTPEKYVKIDQVYSSEFSNFYLGRSAVHVGTNKMLLTGSAAGTNIDDIKTRAFGELTERFVSYVSGEKATRCIVSSYESLIQKGISCVNPIDVVQHSPLCSVPEINTTSLYWVEGQSLINNSPSYVPALITYLRWRIREEEVLFTHPDSCGIAAHTTYEQALQHSILEIIERDAVILSWRTKNYPTAKIPLTLLPEHFSQIIANLGLTIELFAIGEKGLPPTFLAILHNKGESLTCGFACDLYAANGITRALNEALMVQFDIRLFQREVPLPTVPKSSSDHLNLAYYCRGNEVISWYQSKPHVDYEDLIANSPKRLNLEEIGKIMESDILCVDISLQEKAFQHWYVLRSIIPGASKKETSASMKNILSARIAKFSSSSDVDNLSPHPFG